MSNVVLLFVVSIQTYVVFVTGSFVFVVAFTLIKPDACYHGYHVSLSAILPWLDKQNKP